MANSSVVFSTDIHCILQFSKEKLRITQHMNILSVQYRNTGFVYISADVTLLSSLFQFCCTNGASDMSTRDEKCIGESLCTNCACGHLRHSNSLQVKSECSIFVDYYTCTSILNQFWRRITSKKCKKFTNSQTPDKK